jgi:hypothetical protein
MEVTDSENQRLIKIIELISAVKGFLVQALCYKMKVHYLSATFISEAESFETFLKNRWRNKLECWTKKFCAIQLYSLLGLVVLARKGWAWLALLFRC